MTNHSTKLVSIVIPTFNHGNYVLATIESVLVQTYSNYEIIVVNDGSPDDTAELLLPLVKSGLINYIEQPNSGQAAARNRGLAEAKGEFVAFLDDDDLWPTDKLEWQVAMLNESADTPIVGGGVARIDMNGQPVSDWCYGPVTLERNDLFGGPPFVSPGQTLIRRSALLEVGGYDSKIWGSDDYDLYLRLAELGNLRIAPKIALFYRVHPQNASHQYFRMFINSRRVLEKHSAAMTPQNQRDANRWLYHYSGEPASQRLKAAMRHGQFFQAVEELKILGHFAQACIRDLHLGRLLIRDLVPKGLRTAWQQRRGKNGRQYAY